MTLSYFNWETLPLPSYTDVGIEQAGPELLLSSNDFSCFGYAHESSLNDPFSYPFVQSEPILDTSNAFATAPCYDFENVEHLPNTNSVRAFGVSDWEEHHLPNRKRQKLEHGYAIPDISNGVAPAVVCQPNPFEYLDHQLSNFKRRELDHCYGVPELGFFGGNYPAPPHQVPLTCSAPPSDEFGIPAPLELGSSGFYSSVNYKKSDNRVGNYKAASPQSIAARHRRRRISEKTQELAKLIPLGQKMNTAEMFQAAAKYVIFLQAQMAILKVIASGTVGNMSSSVECHLTMLLQSQLIQEKLASEEKCLVPEESLKILAKDPDIQEKPFVSKEIKELLRDDG